MDDVTRALERAAEELDCGYIGCERPCKMCLDRSRAAVLAFLKEMPDWESVTGPATDPVETPKYYRMSLLIAAIEKDRT